MDSGRNTRPIRLARWYTTLSYMPGIANIWFSVQQEQNVTDSPAASWWPLENYLRDAAVRTETKGEL